MEAEAVDEIAASTSLFTTTLPSKFGNLSEIYSYTKTNTYDDQAVVPHVYDIEFMARDPQCVH